MTDSTSHAPQRDPLAGSNWSRPATVAGFVQSPPNANLVSVAAAGHRAAARLLDIGCGAGRNAIPLARAGWDVFGTDLSLPMLRATLERTIQDDLRERCRVLLAPMEELPFMSSSFDFVVAHGIWNLARSAAQFRAAVAEAGRVARPGAALFVFTFSRNTLPPDTAPVPGEPFTFTEFSGEPQCFLTADQLHDELATGGFVPDPALPLHELNLPKPGTMRTSGPPVIYEGLFRRQAR